MSETSIKVKSSSPVVRSRSKSSVSRDADLDELIKVITCDETFNVRREVAQEFGFIKTFLDQSKEFGDSDDQDSNKKTDSKDTYVVKLPDLVTGPLFQQMLLWVDYHIENPDFSFA